MKRIILGILGALLLATAVYTQASAISIRVTVDGVNSDATLTTRQVALMNRALTDFNAGRTANGQAAVTMGTFLRGVITAALRDQVEGPAEANEQAEACAIHMARTPAQRATIEAASFGGKNPCK